MKIKMTSIPVHDPLKAFKHYTEVLGFQKYMFNAKDQLAIVVSPDETNGTALLLEPTKMPSYQALQSELYNKLIPCITFSVEDIKAEYIRLTNLDVKFSKEPTKEAWGWDALFDDGQGNHIQLIQETS